MSLPTHTRCHLEPGEMDRGRRSELGHAPNVQCFEAYAHQTASRSSPDHWVSSNPHLDQVHANPCRSRPFNAPLLLTLQPLIGAIAAGCPALIKPSDLSVHCSNLIAQLVHKYLDRDCYCVVNGGVDQCTRLLDLRWASSKPFFCSYYLC